MFKCGSYALLFALSLIGFSLGFSGSAGAQSIYDDVYQQVDDLKIGGTTYGDEYTCDIEDVSTNFLSRAKEADMEYGDESWKASLDGAIAGNGRWIVSQEADYLDSSNLPNGDKMYKVVIYWTEDDSLALYWHNSQVLATGSELHYLEFTFKEYYTGYNYQCDRLGAMYFDPTEAPTAYVSNEPSPSFPLRHLGYIVYVDPQNLNLPPNYDGIIPRDSVEGGDGRELFRPDFKYTIVDKKISLSDHNQALPEFVPEDGYNMVEYLVEWTVIRCDGHDPDEDFEQQGLCKGSEYVTSDRLPQSDTFEYEVGNYGNYQLRAQYLVEMCHRYPSYPTTPDHCFYVEVGTQYEAYIWGETTKNVTIDGRTILGDTALESCDEFNICTRPSQDSVLSEYFQDKNASGLMMFLQAPIVFYQSLPAMTQSCSPITVPFLGDTLELECLRPRYQELSPFLYTMFQTVVNGVVAYAVATKIFARIKNVNDPENDRIEVARL